MGERGVSRRVAWYRFRSSFRRRWGGYLAIALLIGSIGGLAMGALVAARRTQSSFPAFLKSTNPSDLVVLRNDSSNDSNAPDASFRRTIARLPRVRSVESVTFPSVLTLAPNGAPASDAAHHLFDSAVHAVASVDGLFYDQDRPTVTHGRLANPQRADEMVMTAGAAHILGLRVGDVVPFGFYTNAQTLQQGYGTSSQKPVRRIDVKLVGIVVFHNEVVRDDFDRSAITALFTPALTKPLERCCANTVASGLQLDRGGRDVVAVEAEIKHALPQATVYSITSLEEATAERAIKPEAIALGVFGGIAALAALLIAAQALGRQLHVGAVDLDTFRALGAGPAVTATDGLIGALGGVVVGAVLAAVVAAGLSPLSPIGPVRPLYPSRGVAFDWTVLAIGMVALIVVLGAVAAVIAHRAAPHRVARRSRRITARRSNAARVAAASGLSAPAVTGLHFALEPGRGRNAVPVRSAIVGAALAVVVLVATVTFGASLRALVSHPALYGWNWNDELLGPYGGFADVPQPGAGRLLERDPDVAAWSGVSFDTLRIDGQTVPVLGMTPRAAVGPPMLTGHALEARDQAVLGATTLALLHKHVGDAVELDNGGAKPTRLTIVGTATLPAIGVTNKLHLEIGTGAVLSDALIPVAHRGFGDLPGSPEAILVRFRDSADPASAHRSLQRIVASPTMNVLGHGPPLVVTVQRPAEIVNYRTVGTTPALLGTGLSTGAVVALGLTLIASVRRRRHDLALLKTFGFTRRQLAATVAWQSSVAVAIGVAVGAPLGVFVGRSLWDQFANQLHVVPKPSVPAATIVLIVIGALVLANLVAAIPGRQAARTPTAVLLQTE